jgi:hypothetical protein
MQEEPEARWPLLTLARVREAQAALEQRRHDAGTPASSAGRQRDPGAVAGAAAAAGGYGGAAHSDIGSGTRSDAAAGSGSSGPEPGATAAETSQPSADTPAGVQAGRLYEQLAALDPMRAGYYRDAAAGRAHVVLRAAHA